MQLEDGELEVAVGLHDGEDRIAQDEGVWGMAPFFLLGKTRIKLVDKPVPRGGEIYHEGEGKETKVGFLQQGTHKSKFGGMLRSIYPHFCCLNFGS